MASTSSATYYFITRCLSLSKAYSHFSSRCLSVVEGTIISILLKSVCFLEHLWCSFENSKTASFQQISVNFVILKQIQKIYTQWLRELRSQTFSLCSATNSSITRCLSVVEGTFSLLIPLPEPVEGRARKNWLFLFVLMLQFLFYSPPNFVQKSTNLFIHNSFKEM